jgi:dolichol-phosphate mannosyltransferase
VIWVVLPAFNEEASLPGLLDALDRAMRERRVDYRVIAVNDGSRDGTAEILQAFVSKMPMDVITHPINRGLGETERDGFEYVAARCTPDDVIVRLEGDDTHKPEYIFSLIAKLDEGYEIVNTSRFQPGGGQTGVDGYRAFISRGANLFMSTVFGIPGVRDFSCGFRAYRGRVIRDAVEIFGNSFIQLRGLGFTSTLEMIVKLHLLGCRFAEVPFVLRYDEKRSPSKMVGSITTIGYLLMGFLYQWPFGGWRSQYRGLASIYRENPAKAIERYQLATLRRHRVSQISF